MKRILITILFFYTNLLTIPFIITTLPQRIMRLSRNIPTTSRNIPPTSRNIPTTSRNIPPGFGRTHFIIRGHHHTAPPFARSKNKTAPPLLKPVDTGEQVCGAFFTPGDDLQSRLISLIDHEQEGIQIAMYLFTDPKIATALCKAYEERGVSVELITDISCIHNRYNKVENLCNKISVFVYHPKSSNPNANRAAGLMHNKFLVFKKNKEDKSFVWTGSANFTRVALTRNNEENVVVIDDKNIVRKFSQQFERIKKKCKRYRSPFDEPAE